MNFGFSQRLTGDGTATWCANQPRPSGRFTTSSAHPTAFTRVHRVQACVRRRLALVLEKVSSIGEKSGKYDGKNKTLARRASINSSTRSPL